MIEQLAIQRLLNEELIRAKERNPGYSLRALARRLGIGPATLSQLLSGKRKISHKLAERVTTRLMLGPKERSAILRLFSEKNTVQAVDAGRMRLESDRFELIADWHHFALLSLLETSGVPRGREALVGWSARRLGLAVRTARAALERLVRMSLAAEDALGRLRPNGQGVVTTDGVSNAAVRKNHHQVLELARQSLERDELARRDFTSVTMAIDPAKLPEAKRLIRGFRDSLCGFLESGQKKDVYNLSIQLIPLTQDEGNIE
jgi:uncharacterized protein (TIGR02147 family)